MKENEKMGVQVCPAWRCRHKLPKCWRKNGVLCSADTNYQKKGTDLQLKDKSRTIKQGSKGVPLLRCIQKLAKERTNINNGLRGIHIFFPCVLQITNSTSTMSWSVWKLHLRSSLLWRLALLFTLIGVMIWISQHRQTPKKLLLTHTRARRTHIYPFYDLHWDESEHLNFDLK